MKDRFIPKPSELTRRIQSEEILVAKARRRAQAAVARAGQSSGSRSLQRKADNAEIADYLARNPNPVKSV
jgi:hypothetical protein